MGIEPRQHISCATKIRRARLGILAASVALGGMGCVTPPIHPLRATNGVVGEIVTSLQLPSGATTFCHTECASEATSAPGFSPAQGSIGYSGVVKGSFGVMGGLYAPAMVNHQRSYAAGALWTYFTVQNDYVAVGVGPEVGFGGVATMLGVEIQPLGIQQWTKAIGVFGRGFIPYQVSNQVSGGSPMTLEGGARGRWGPFLFQYSYYQPTKGLAVQLNPIEGSLYAEAFHILSLGFTFDAITVRAFRSAEATQ